MLDGERSPLEVETHLSLPDLSKLPLPDMLDSDDSALANSVRRLLKAMHRPGENYTAHGTTPYP